MSSSAAFAMSSAPAGDKPGLRALDVIAATSAGGVPQSRIHRILTDLEAPLAALHAQGLVHGALSPSTIGLDVNGKAHLMPRAAPDGGAAAAAPASVDTDTDASLPQSGYAAFEQYADDELLPRGPWTDIYALSAVACQLITGAPPPDAEARRDHDAYVPLAQRMPAGYDAAFLAAIDAGLAMAAARRPNSLAAYLALFGGMEPAPAMPALPEPEVVVVQPDYDEDEGEDEPPPPLRGRRHLPFWWLSAALLLAVVALPLWVWMQSNKEPGPGRSLGADRSPTSSFVPLSQRDAGSSEARSSQEGLPQPGTMAGAGAGPDAAQGRGRATAAPSTAAPEATDAQGRGASPVASGSPPGSGLTAAAGGDTASGAAAAPGRRAPQPYQSTTTLGAAGAPAAGVEAPNPGPQGAAQGERPRAAEAGKLTPRGAVPVRVDVRPWGEIVIDGVSRGISPPLKELRLAPGKYAVTIRNTGLPSYRMTLEVKAGTPAVIAHVFK